MPDLYSYLTQAVPARYPVPASKLIGRLTSVSHLPSPPPESEKLSNSLYPARVVAHPGVHARLQQSSTSLSKRHDPRELPPTVGRGAGQGSAGVTLAGVRTAPRQVSCANHPVGHEPPAVDFHRAADAIRDQRHHGTVQDISGGVRRVRQLGVCLPPAGDVALLAGRWRRAGRQAQRLHVRAESHRLALTEAEFEDCQVVDIAARRVRAVTGVGERVFDGERLLVLLAGVAPIVLPEFDLQSVQRRPETVCCRQDEPVADQGAAAVMLEVSRRAVRLDLRLPRVVAVCDGLATHHAPRCVAGGVGQYAGADAEVG